MRVDDALRRLQQLPESNSVVDSVEATSAEGTAAASGSKQPCTKSRRMHPYENLLWIAKPPVPGWSVVAICTRMHFLELPGLESCADQPMALGPSCIRCDAVSTVVVGGSLMHPGTTQSSTFEGASSPTPARIVMLVASSGVPNGHCVCTGSVSKEKLSNSAMAPRAAEANREQNREQNNLHHKLAILSVGSILP